MDSITETTAVATTENKLPTPVAERGISKGEWRTMMNLFPGADPHSVLMVWDYCRARKLDPLKKPCHIVPMRVKDARTGEYAYRDVVMPGIYEYRTTATRTGEYLGHSKPEYGPVVEYLGVTVPEWCELTVYRWNQHAKAKCEFPVRVYFREAAATKFDTKTKTRFLNDRWTSAPIQMMTKCTEAAGLREAFPDEIGGEATADELEGHAIEAKLVTSPHSTTEGKEHIDPETVESLRDQMLELMTADVDEDAMALNVFDFEINVLGQLGERRIETVEAVWALIGSKSRAAWKKLKSNGEKIANTPAFAK
jgi:phage recombination protein Bet